jgi:hypothetical protein
LRFRSIARRAPWGNLRAVSGRIKRAAAPLASKDCPRCVTANPPGCDVEWERVLSFPYVTQPENAYVALMTMSIGITNMCDGYDVDDMTVSKFAQERGVEIHRLGPATFNALEAVVGSSYDPTALIPEVTLLVRTVLDKMNHDVSKSGKAAVCKLYGKHLTDAGFLRVK